MTLPLRVQCFILILSAWILCGFTLKNNAFADSGKSAEKPVLKGSSLEDFEKSFLTLLLETPGPDEFLEYYPVYVSISVYVRAYQSQLETKEKEARDIIREKVNILLQAAEGRTVPAFLDRFAESEPQIVQSIRQLLLKMKEREKEIAPDQKVQAVASIKKTLRTASRTLNGETVINASSARNLFNSLFRVIAAFDSEKDFFLAAAISESFMPDLLADQEGEKEGTKKVVNFYNYFFESCTGPEFLKKVAEMESFKEVYQSLLTEYEKADDKKRAQIRERMDFYKSKVRQNDLKNKNPQEKEKT